MSCWAAWRWRRSACWGCHLPPAVGGLDLDLGLHAGGFLHGADRRVTVASTWKVTRMGGGPPWAECRSRVKRARGRQSATSSRPRHADGHRGCSHRPEVNSGAGHRNGGIARDPFSSKPPMVSTQESGMTSSSSMLGIRACLPTWMSAWMAAPMATTLSRGSMLVNGVRRRTHPPARAPAAQVEPPTITTSRYLSASKLHRAGAPTDYGVRLTRGWIEISQTGCGDGTLPAGKGTEQHRHR